MSEEQTSIPQGERTKHHYIPVFYLSNWTSPTDGNLCEFSRPYKTPPGKTERPVKAIPMKAKRVHPNGTGYIKNLYKFPDLNPRMRNFLEDRFFLRVDDDGARVMQRLLNGDTEFDANAKSAWARFLMSMFHRSPENIDRVLTMMTPEYVRSLEPELRPRYEQRVAEKGGGPTWDELVANFKGADYQQFALLLLHRIMDSERVGTVLTNMIWTVAPRYGIYPLFTSDRPIWMTPLGQNDAHLIMPLTPDHFFFAGRDEATLHMLEQTNLHRGLAEVVNNRLVRQARRFVYARDDKRKQFMQNRLGDRLSWSPLE
ncbi:MAG: DUF4238 domain-containing protein [Alphaproteobacteria bacterium]|nr:DUF4238 domain-containing protein [Alphaproteobacteria bacterium]